jgi:hypothetical protein
MSDEPVTVEPVVEPKPGVAKPAVQPGPLVGGDPSIHGEAAQRIVNKASRHSERVQNGQAVAPHEPESLEPKA